MKISFFLIVFVSILCTNCQSKVAMLPYVTGVITNIELVTIPNKAAGKPDRQETRITLKLESAVDQNDKPIELKDFDSPTFAGSPYLITEFSVFQKVKIVCSSSTGRHIASIHQIK